VADAALAVVGVLIVLIALADLFVTIFNYDGFSFLANRLHGLLWRVMRWSVGWVPERQRHTVLSLGSASMLPATYVFWLGLEVIGFALIFQAGLRAHGFVPNHVGTNFADALYLSGGAVSSLTFGDAVPHTMAMRAGIDVETIVGLTTFTLALGYVVTTFGVLRTLDGLHAIVRRHADDPGKPSSVLARHFRGGQPTELPAVLESIAEKLEDYDEGLRRYPIVYYFHTRRLARSIPRIFSDLGRLLALLRWGLPASEAMTQDPLLAALLDEYGMTLERLQRSFVGPPDLQPPEPVSRAEFASERGQDDPHVSAFRELQHTARAAAGIDSSEDEGDSYSQYREWLPFAYRNQVVIARVADALGYDVESS
jgi:hypothetical protein